jgi:hypothetical protein
MPDENNSPALAHLPKIILPQAQKKSAWPENSL